MALRNSSLEWRDESHSVNNKYKADIVSVKFVYSEKGTIFCKISTRDLSFEVTVKSMKDISQNFVGFSEHMNFKITKVKFK